MRRTILRAQAAIQPGHLLRIMHNDVEVVLRYGEDREIVLQRFKAQQEQPKPGVGHPLFAFDDGGWPEWPGAAGNRELEPEGK